MQDVPREHTSRYAIARLLRREKVFAYRYAGRRCDCGSKLGFLQATVDLGEQHAEVGDEFRAWLAQRACVVGCGLAGLADSGSLNYHSQHEFSMGRRKKRRLLSSKRF